MTRIKLGLAILLMALFAVGIIGCSHTSKTSANVASSANQANQGDSTKQEDAQAADNTNDTRSQADATSDSAKQKWPYAVIETNRGRIVIQLFPHKALKTVENFIRLANAGFYNGIKWHRVEPGFVIEGGDPLSKDNNHKDDGLGGPGYTIPAEINDVPHLRGTVGMAHNAKDINSAGSLFYICLTDQPKLDGKYTVFGTVTEGMDVVDKIQKYDVMNKVYIIGK